ncbi:RTX-I toxin determinant A from serotypes 1/9 [Rubripirellula lacrimiformis]|uniref:RTX-I toxin determinant A from serotypes 1/9 n=1 Tax=Rubripirellula lacrimiformis TaxID=1930273 RepID=A0A517NGL3_9BACT|nr:G8 domain-containing protein [Rubripirellula lacrimiformis]QDT06272.1 RTX-I toxin determinant A from serotypes 1/9 [Rubripirellula lacrimiformis]
MNIALRRSQARRLNVESLESRRLLAGNLSLGEVSLDESGQVSAAVAINVPALPISALSMSMGEQMSHSGVTVTPTEVITHHDRIPRFAANPTFIAVTDGDWSDPPTWQNSEIPGPGAIVSVPQGRTVIYDVDSDVRIDAIEISGHLKFATDTPTSLWLNEIMVMPHGSLTIGTAGQPIQGNVKAEIVFTDTPQADGHHFKTGTVENPGIDPSQWGNGLIVLGGLDIYGAEKTAHVRSQADLESGATKIDFQTLPANWTLGDTLLLPETSQTPITKKGIQINESETVLIASLENGQVQTETALKYDHYGITENSFDINRFAHVANLSRNVRIRSENPEGVRGHVAATAGAIVHLENAEFVGLGRTSSDEFVDDTVTETSGNLVQIGRNVAGRYSVHLHHLSHPAMVDGIVVRDARKWGIVVHETNDSTIRDSIVYDVDGAGIVTESGNETGNRFENNLVIQVNGGHQTDDPRAGAVEAKDAVGKRFIEIGNDGSGFWLRASEGEFIGNTVYDAVGYGFNFNGYYRTPDISKVHRQLDVFKDNEAVSSKGGLWFSWSQGQFDIDNYAPNPVRNFLAWHVSHDGLKTYHDANLGVDGFVVIGNPSVSSRNEGSPFTFDTRANSGIWMGNVTYENYNHVGKNVKIEGMNFGIVAPINAGDQGMQLHDVTLRNYVNIAFPREADPDAIFLSDVSFLPSHVSKIAASMPEQTANVWDEDTGILIAGTMSSDLPPGVVPRLPVEWNQTSDGRLIIRSGESSDSIAVRVVDDLFLFTINSQEFQIPVEGIHQFTFFGGDGDDLFVNDTNVRLVALGGAGRDTILGGGGDDSILGGDDDDFLDGRGGDDVLQGNDGNDVIFGGDGADRIRAGAGDDWIDGGGGSDPVLAGGEGNDFISGGLGDDVLVGGNGNDRLDGGDGDDLLAGQSGHDILFGRLGDDILSGGDDDDWLDGGEGIDKLRGGLGEDIILFDQIDSVIDGEDLRPQLF